MLRPVLAAAALSPLLLWAALALNISLRETLDRRAAAPTEGRFVRAGDLDLFVQELGPENGEVVLFTHGMGAWSGLWRIVLEPVCGKVRCVAVDLPPFGYSQPAPDLDYGRPAQARRLWALADALGAKKVSIVGHSFGGGPAAEMALQHPERVRRLVLIAPALSLGQPDAVPGPIGALLYWPAFGRLAVSATMTNPLLLRRGLGNFMADPKSATAEMAAVLRRPIYVKGKTGDLAGWLPRFLYGRERCLSKDESAFARLTMPTLLIWGDKDKTTPLRQGERLKTLIPKSELAVFPGIGHMPHLEAPSPVAARIVAHLSP